MDLLGWLRPVEVVLSYIFYYLHSGLVFLGLNNDGAAAWVLSIVFLTVIIRICILPLFIKQVHSMRKMQVLQPKLQAIQKKYKNKTDAEAKQQMSKETMALYSEEGVNPMGSCLPVLLQSPFFFALYRTLSSIKNIAEGKDSIGAINQEIALKIENSTFFSIKLSDTFNTVQTTPGHIFIGILIACMCTTMFISQKVVSQKNMPQASKESPQYKMTKNMAYIFPLMYIFSGAIFPVGVLIYWFTTNLWTLGQGCYQLYFMPTPGSDASLAKEKRDKKKKENELQKIKEENPDLYKEINKPDEKKKQREQPKKKKSKKG